MRCYWLIFKEPIISWHRIQKLFNPFPLICFTLVSTLQNGKHFRQTGRREQTHITAKRVASFNQTSRAVYFSTLYLQHLVVVIFIPIMHWQSCPQVQRWTSSSLRAYGWFSFLCHFTFWTLCCLVFLCDFNHLEPTFFE